MMHVMERRTNLMQRPADVLHIAPEEALARVLRDVHKGRYTAADIQPWTREMVQLDITSMQLPDQSRDFIVCSHVLEHVTEDIKAMKEIRRVLRPSGIAVVAVPIFAKQTMDGAEHMDPKDRLAQFGSETHVRLYGPDITNRLARAGLSVTAVDERLETGNFNDTAVHIPQREAERLVFLCARND